MSQRFYSRVVKGLFIVLLVMAESGNVTGGESAGRGWSASGSVAVQRGTKGWVRVAGNQSVPVIARADVIVVGSTLDGCFLAERLARTGRRVVLASSGTSLPQEIIMALRPWVKSADVARAPADVRAFLNGCVKAKDGDEVILDLIGVTEGLEDRVLDAGVRLYYDLEPCGVQTDGSRVTAVVFGCKGGLVAVEANAVVDCTPGARAARLAGAKLSPRKSPDMLVAYSMLCEKPPAQRVMAADGVPELVDGQVRMHGDYAEFRMRLPVSESVCDESAYDLEARRIAAEAAAVLTRSVFKNSKFVRGGDVLLAAPAARVASRADKHDRVSVDACRPKEVDNVLVCGPAIDVEDDVAAKLVEPLSGASLADVLTAAPWDELIKAPGGREPRIALSCVQPVAQTVDRSNATFTELSPIFRTDSSISLGGVSLPIVADCEVLVVGAGTSGMPAAVVAARRGADTIAVEKYGDVGGTHTIGGVSKYWFGRSTEFVQRLDADALNMMQQTHMPECMGKLGTMMKSGVRLLTHCTAVGTLVEGRSVAGVVVVTPQGLAAIKAKRIIDATGDGDIATRAGSDMTYGTRRDAMTLWYSFAQYAGTNPEAQRHFAYVVDPRDPTEMTRAIIAGRRFKRGNSTAPQYYLTPRESRHIRGGYHVTVADVLAERRFEDLLLICRSNFDIKGIEDSDLSFSGYVEWSRLKEYSVQIPYRAIRPVDLENILVIGKAYSVSHDALALARMQRDMMAMGGAAGLIAAECAHNNVSFANVDFKQMHKELLALGVLSQQDLDTIEGVKDNALPAMSDGELRQRINGLAAGQLPLDGQVRILARPEAAIPLLKEALAKADGKGRVELARALCFLGDPNGSPILLEELKRLLSDEKLPGISRGRVTPHDLPDQGFAPDATYLINTLARLGDRGIIPFLTDIAKKIEPETGKTGTMFSYIFSVCYAAERLGAGECVEALTILADKPGISGSGVPRGADPRRTARGSASMRDDRYAYLELCVGRALARCGCRRGYLIMLDYLNDIRGSLARSAHDELVQLSGQESGYDKQAWQRWLAKADIRPQKRNNR
jgi:flavin-dependent dehydrogenase